MEGEAFDKFDFDSAIGSWSRLKIKELCEYMLTDRNYTYIDITCFLVDSLTFFYIIIVYLVTLKYYLVQYLTDITIDEEWEWGNSKITTIFFWEHPWNMYTSMELISVYIKRGETMAAMIK